MPCASSASACTSTSSGRLPSRTTVTTLPAHRLRMARQEDRRGIAHFAQALLGHHEHAELVGAAEAVLDRAHDTEAARRVAFEVQHRVDHVLEDARTGDLAFLGHVADQQHRRARVLREPHQSRRRFAHLHGRTRRGFAQLGLHGLDRVDHEHLRARGDRLLDHRLDARLRGQAQARAASSPSRCAREATWRTDSSPET